MVRDLNSLTNSKEEFIELLKEALRARLKSPSLPPKLNMEENREYLLKLTGSIDNPFRPGTKFYTAINLEDSIEYRLPPNFQLEQILKDAKSGDYILLVYLGPVKTSAGRTVKQYAGAILSEEEAQRLVDEFKLKKTENKKEKRVEKKAVEEKKEEKREEIKEEGKRSVEKKVEEKVEQKVEEKKIEKNVEEVKKFIDALIEVYGSAKLSEIDYFINKVKKLNIEINQQLLEQLGFVVQDNIVRKKK